MQDELALHEVSGPQVLAVELSKYPPKQAWQMPVELIVAQLGGIVMQLLITRKYPISQLEQMPGSPLQLLQPVLHRSQVELVLFKNLLGPQLRQVVGSAVLQLLHPLKHRVQLVVPMIWTEPTSHPLESQEPGPALSHFLQYWAQGVQRPAEEFVK